MIKVKFSVWESDSHHLTQEHELEFCHDFDDLVRDFEKAVELRRHRVDERKRKVAEIQVPPMTAEEAYGGKANDKDWGAHGRVWEYDGAFRCLNCRAEWGALSGAPKEPPEKCEPVSCYYCPREAEYEGWLHSQSGDMSRKRYVCKECVGLLGTRKI